MTEQRPLQACARRLAVGVAALAALAAVAGCGNSASTSTGSAAVSATPPASGCGSFDLPAVRDASGTMASLPAKQRDAYRALSVSPSAWADWKPSHDPPYRVGIVWSAQTNQFLVDLLDDLKADLMKTGLVGDLDVAIAGDNVNIPLQLQQLRSMVQKSPDLIMTLPLQPEAFDAVVNDAGRHGIPVVTFFGTVNSPSAINVDANSALAAATTTSMLVRSLGGKGNVMTVEGIPTTTVNAQTLAGVKSVLKNCPDIKYVGSTVGSFSNATAKGAVSQFLATHPQRIDGVVQAGGMGQGVLEAFQSVGRPVPFIGDLGATRAVLAYWRDHRSSYHGAATAQSAPGSAQALSDVIKRVLNGGGPRVNALVPPVTLITDDNLDKWVEDSWTSKTVGTADGPPDAFMSNEYLAPLFTKQTP